ncbi:protein fuzzy homolog isoform X2 [Xenia sp. Carnegie-2017]|nr:protein fuzzy homolog isoform X2 [Xenia sp. Carnegie-2017]
MFARNQDVKLLNTITEGDAKVVWKMFHDSVILILVTSNDDSSDFHTINFLDLIYNAMVLHVGSNAVTATQNVEKLKRDLRVCYSVFDRIMEGSDLCGYLTLAVDVILCMDVAVLQEYLDAFVEAVNSEFGCLLVMGKVAVASGRWWDLSSTELVLLSLLITSQPECSSRDIPIFLPQGSPKVAHRLATFQIVEGVEICVICGPNPSLLEIEEKFLFNYWNPAIDNVKQCLLSHPRNLTPSMSLDNGVLGFILVNTDERKCLCSVFPGGVHSLNNKANEDLTRTRRKSLLTSFYKSVVGSLFPTPQTVKPLPEYIDLDFTHNAMETYYCAADHKAYAIRNDTYQLFALFSKNVPNYALRMLTEETLNVLTKDRLV